MCSQLSHLQASKAKPITSAEMQRNFGTFVLLPLSFIVGMVMTNINKFIYTRYDFAFPLMITMFNMLFSWGACVIFLKWRGEAKVDLPWNTFIYHVTPIALTSAASIGSANIALVYLFPSFHLMINSATPLLTVISTRCMFRYRYNTATWISMIPICGGSFLCIGGELNFQMTGLIFSFLALAFRAVKNALQGYLLYDCKLDAMGLLSLVSPIGFVVFAAWSALQEGFAPWERILQPGDFELKFALLMSCVCACSYNIISFLLIKYLSVVVSAVLLNIRCPCSIMVSLLVFGNSVTMTQFAGFACVTGGVLYHNKYGKRLKDEDMHNDIEIGDAKIFVKEPPVKEEEQAIIHGMMSTENEDIDTLSPSRTKRIHQVERSFLIS